MKVGDTKKFNAKDGGEAGITDAYLIVRIDMMRGEMEIVDHCDDADEAQERVLARLRDENAGTGTTVGFIDSFDW